MYAIFSDYSHAYFEGRNQVAAALEEAARRGVKLLRMVEELND